MTFYVDLYCAPADVPKALETNPSPLPPKVAALILAQTSMLTAQLVHLEARGHVVREDIPATPWEKPEISITITPVNVFRAPVVDGAGGEDDERARLANASFCTGQQTEASVGDQVAGTY